jgi:hypothetical protein
MAKKGKKKATKKATKTASTHREGKKPGVKGNPPEVALLPTIKKAVAIFSEVLVHFGAGYCAEAAREASSPVPPSQLQPPPAPPFPVPTFTPLDIFIGADVLQRFQILLLASTFKNRSQIDWFTPGSPDRRTICKMAFLHGMYARQIVVRDRIAAVDSPTLKESFDMVHKFCPSAGGGGPVCEFGL